jgi:hypothetical protein
MVQLNNAESIIPLHPDRELDVVGKEAQSVLGYATNFGDTKATEDHSQTDRFTV